MMQQLTKEGVDRILRRKFDVSRTWLKTQFADYFQKEIGIYGLNQEVILASLAHLLNCRNVQKVIVFAEPAYHQKLTPALVEPDELYDFVIKKLSKETNIYVSDIYLRWICTFSHDNDFFISGPNETLADFSKFFPTAKIIPLKKSKQKIKKNKNFKHKKSKK